MSKEFSFDIVSDYDPQEMNNAVDQAKREAENRYDFKGTSPQIDFEEGKTGIVMNVDSEYKLNALLDIFESKMLKRNLSLKILDKARPTEEASGGRVRKHISFKKGLSTDQAKEITKKIREVSPKSRALVQGDSVRVSSAKKDDLQEIMQALRGAELSFPIQFTNFK